MSVLKLVTSLVLFVLLFGSCSKPVINTALSNTYVEKTRLKMEVALHEMGAKKLTSKSVIKTLVETQKKVRSQAIKNIKKTESFQKWQFYQSADSSFAWLSFVAPHYVVLSKALVSQLDTTSTLDYSPIFYHFWAHYEKAHFRKRTESALVSEFGGSSLALAVDFNAEHLVDQLIVQNGGKGIKTFWFPFSIDEEAEAEDLASKAFKSGRKDSVVINDAWKKINPDLDWADDFLKIHSGKIKMAK